MLLEALVAAVGMNFTALSSPSNLKGRADKHGEGAL